MEYDTNFGDDEGTSGIGNAGMLGLDDGTFKLIDPEDVIAEREFDLGVLMRVAPGEDDLHERADWLAAATGCNRSAIWEWGTAERVLSGLWCRLIDFQPHGDRQLADAERFCEA